MPQNLPPEDMMIPPTTPDKKAARMEKIISLTDLDFAFASEALKQDAMFLRTGCKDDALLIRARTCLRQYIDSNPPERFAVAVKIELALIEGRFQNEEEEEALILECFERPFGNLPKISQRLIMLNMSRRDFGKCFEIARVVEGNIESKNYECHNNTLDFYWVLVQLLSTNATETIDSDLIGSLGKIEKCWRIIEKLKNEGLDLATLEGEVFLEIGECEAALDKFEEAENGGKIFAPYDLALLYEKKACVFASLGDGKNTKKSLRRMEKFGGKPSPSFVAQIRKMKTKKVSGRSVDILLKCSYFNCDAVETKPKEYLQCGKCRKAVYCCAEHQKLHWKAGHKMVCKAPKKQR